MPFREKVKKALGGTRNSRDDPDSNYPPRRSDIEYYKPHEIPRSKYRGPWNQKHQDSLQAFSFQEATQNRKGSIPASYSPRGTNAMSRRSSWLSKARSSLGSRSDQEGAKTPRRMSQMSHVGPVVEDADDDADVGNVGLSRRATTDERSAEGANELAKEKTLTQSDVAKGNGQPFTPEQLSKAMTAATIQQQG